MALPVSSNGNTPDLSKTREIEKNQASDDMNSSLERSRQVFHNQQREQDQLIQEAETRHTQILNQIHHPSSLSNLEKSRQQLFASHIKQSKDSLDLVRKQLKESQAWGDFETKLSILRSQTQIDIANVDLNNPKKQELQAQFLEAQKALTAWRKKQIESIQHLPVEKRLETLQNILNKAFSKESDMSALYIQKMKE